MRSFMGPGLLLVTTGESLRLPVSANENLVHISAKCSLIQPKLGKDETKVIVIIF